MYKMAACHKGCRSGGKSSTWLWGVELGLKPSPGPDVGFGKLTGAPAGSTSQVPVLDHYKGHDLSSEANERIHQVSMCCVFDSISTVKPVFFILCSCHTWPAEGDHSPKKLQRISVILKCPQRLQEIVISALT